MATPQHTVFLVVDGEHFALSLDEAREIITELREPDRGNPEMADAQLAAAVFLERLVDELDAKNPPLTRREARAIGLAITRLEVSYGVSTRQFELRNALLAWDVRCGGRD